MQELRLVGVHEDGRYLLLSAADGTRFRVALNDDLRVAARGRRSGPGTSGPAPSSAREVQALIRTGLSVEEVAERAGWPISKVTVFAAPVLAERRHVAGRAAAVRLRTEGGDSERLSTRVERRLEGRGVHAEDVEWDSGRDDTGAWQVHIDFVAGGRERRAGWRFDPLSEHVQPLDDEARWLTEEDDRTTRVQPHRFGGEQVFDVEKTGGVLSGEGEQVGIISVPEPPARSDQTDALMTAIRAHSHAGERGGRAGGRSNRRRRRADTSDPTLVDAPASPAAVPNADAPAPDAHTPAAQAASPEGADAEPVVPDAAPDAVDADAADSNPADSTAEDPNPADPNPADSNDADSDAASPDAVLAEATAPDGQIATEPAGTAERRLHGADELPFAEFDDETAESASEEAQPAARAGDAPAIPPVDPAPGPERPSYASPTGATLSAAEKFTQAQAALLAAEQAAQSGAPATATPARSAPADVNAGSAEPPVETRASRRAAAEAAAEQAGALIGDGVDFAASDEIPPPARGTHPRDITRDRAAEPASVTESGEAMPSPEPEPAAADDPKPSPKPVPPAKRKGRVGVPSWNDVMFGPPRGGTDAD